jgi:hypothetical protein
MGPEQFSGPGSEQEKAATERPEQARMSGEHVEGEQADSPEREHDVYKPTFDLGGLEISEAVALRAILDEVGWESSYRGEAGLLGELFDGDVEHFIDANTSKAGELVFTLADSDNPGARKSAANNLYDLIRRYHEDGNSASMAVAVDRLFALIHDREAGYAAVTSVLDLRDHSKWIPPELAARIKAMERG